jgi:hypothetical protein
MTASRLKKMMISLLRIAAALRRGNGDHLPPLPQNQDPPAERLEKILEKMRVDQPSAQRRKGAKNSLMQ